MIISREGKSMMRQVVFKSEDAKDIWRYLCRKLRAQMSSSLYRTCFSGTIGVEIRDNTLFVAVPSSTVREEIQRRFGERVHQLITAQLEHSLNIEYITPSLSIPNLLKNRNQETKTIQTFQKRQNIELEQQSEISRLYPQYTFDNFVVGDSNRFAFAAAQSVVQSPGQTYNPLFLYGGVGLGKTHLLMAIGHQLSSMGNKVCYLTTETFVHEAQEAIQNNSQEAFRNRYRKIDVLLVDDIHFIGGNKIIEEEFFHTFNALHAASHQIVLTSDRPPRAIPTLHDRLRSRFEWGLLADISSPGYEDRFSIVCAKAAGQDISIPSHFLEYLSRPDGATVRHLEGALNRLIAAARLNSGQVTMAMVALTIRECFGEEAHLDVAPNVVIDAVAHLFRVSTSDLLGKGRTKQLALPRQVAMYLLREVTDLSLSQIGKILGGRDHTTVMHGCEQVISLLRQDGQARREIDTLRATLASM
jgi:chromosomal replication initiator protein